YMSFNTNQQDQNEKRKKQAGGMWSSWRNGNTFEIDGNGEIDV
ncbi:12967_t:CDS:2, partial [Entrophospora sp. SA101]